MSSALRLAVATPEVIGVLAWWALVLLAPLWRLRRWRRRRSAEDQQRRERVRGALEPEIHIASYPPSAALLSGRIPGDRSPPGEGAGGSSTAALEPLCRYVDFRRRLELAVEELERRLTVLAAELWRIDPYPLSGERGNTLLVLGQTGVFVVSATYAPGSWDDIVSVSRLAAKIQLLLPRYSGRVQPAICHPFSSVEPRLWHRPDDGGEWVGAWLLGGDSLVGWLYHFGGEHGLGVGDLRCFDELCRPNWLRSAIPVPPSWPPLADSSPSPHLEP